MKKFLLLTVASAWLAIGSFAQTTCATAVIAEIGTNQAPAQSELWYKFSVSGKPLASYSVGYDSKS
ncbi:MAG: hypothetical protein LBG77_09280, partial [Dysgonamonadaceae bacterium]|nr:hypothetical protein [Dysgonamonadaceae bacterium]